MGPTAHIPGFEAGRTLVDLPDRRCVQGRLRGRAVVAKIDSRPARSRREALALGLARSGGVSVPPVVLHDPAPPVAVLVLEWVSGEHLTDSSDGWRAAGEQLGRLHRLEAPHDLAGFDHREKSWVDFLRWWAIHESARCVALGGLGRREADEMRAEVLDRLGSMPEPRRVVVHGDLQPEHVLVEGDLVTLIDWGDVGTGDPLWDLAILLLDHPHKRHDVLAGYQPDDELVRHVDDHLGLYRLIRYLGEIPWLLERGFDAAASVDGARAVARSLRRST